MPRRPVRTLALALALALLGAPPGCAPRPAPDPAALIATLGLDGAAEALRVRIAADPRDLDARRALAAIEHRRGRPGAVLAELLAVVALDGPRGPRLAPEERARVAGLLRARAAVRVARGAPDGLADLDHARRIDHAAGDDAALRAEAEVVAALADLRHTDPTRRRAGARRLGDLAGSPHLVGRAARFAAIAGAAASVADLGAAGLYLWQHGARRAALERLDAWERAGGRDAADAGPIADAWLAARAWWHGPAGRPDLATLDRAIGLGASRCHFAGAEGEHGCRASAAVGDPAAERAVLARARARGWRTADPAEATAWVAITAAAWRRGELRSWLDELDARVDLAALGAHATPPTLPTAIPAWARAPLYRAAGALEPARLALRRAGDDRDSAAAEVVAIERGLAAGAPGPAGSPPSGAPDSALAAAVAASPAQVAALHEVARGHRRDRAVGDRLAGDLVARELDEAAAADRLAALYLGLGDPTRARGWAERAVAASPADLRLRAGLVRALAAAGDGPAARIHLTTVAAGSGDPVAALLDGARALAAADLPIEALPPLKLALELAPPGAQADVLVELVAVAARLGRDAQRRSFEQALAAERPPPDPASPRARARAGDPALLAALAAADPADPALALAAAAADPDDAAAVARLVVAAAWSPRDVAVRAAIVERAPPGTPVAETARAELAGLAADPSLDRAARLAAAAAASARPAGGSDR